MVSIPRHLTTEITRAEGVAWIEQLGPCAACVLKITISKGPDDRIHFRVFMSQMKHAFWVVPELAVLYRDCRNRSEDLAYC